MYCASTVSEIVILLEDYNTRNQCKDYTSFEPSYNADYKIMFEGSNEYRFSNCSIKIYDYSIDKWRNICSYVRSAKKRKSKVYGTLGYGHISAYFIHPETKKQVRSFLIDDEVRADSSVLDITPEYDDNENIESFLFQKSVLSELEYDTAIKTYLINCISPVLRYGEVSIYDMLYEKSEEELQVIIGILKDALNA